MTIQGFNSLEEIEKYYDEETNTYVFKENEEYIDLVVFNFDLNVKANINAWNISAGNISAHDIDVWNIVAYDINAHDINAWDILAHDISARNIIACNINYYAVCVSHKNIKCKLIKGIRENAKHFVSDEKLEVEE